MSVKAWNENDTQKLLDLYLQDGIEDPHVLCNHFPGKGYRSVISKLVQQQVYKKPELDELRKSKTVKTMLRELEEALDIEIEGTNLNKKSNLVNLVTGVQRLHSQINN